MSFFSELLVVIISNFILAILILMLSNLSANVKICITHVPDHILIPTCNFLFNEHNFYNSGSNQE